MMNNMTQVRQFASADLPHHTKLEMPNLSTTMEKVSNHYKFSHTIPITIPIPLKLPEVIYKSEVSNPIALIAVLTKRRWRVDSDLYKYGMMMDLIIFVV